MRRITFLGTGIAMLERSSCSSLLLQEDTNNLLIDTAGGHQILNAFYGAELHPADVKNVFISHYDSDHILGIVPLIRIFSKDTVKRRVFCSAEVRKAIDSILLYVANNHFKKLKERLEFVVVGDRESKMIGDWKIQFFDIKSKRPQMGFLIIFSDNKKLSFLGDEPYREHYKDLVDGSDVLIHDAFCLETDKDIFDPTPKCHSTVMEAAKNALKLSVKTLILNHMEDKTLETRKINFLAEAKRCFTGEVFVPIDLDVFEF